MNANADQARRTVRELDRRLRELVSVAGNRDADLERVWQDCAAIGQGISDLAELARGASPDDRADLVAELSTLCEFHAIATAFLQHEKTETAKLLSQVQGARESLAFYGTSPDLGQSCDIAG